MFGNGFSRKSVFAFVILFIAFFATEMVAQTDAEELECIEDTGWSERNVTASDLRKNFQSDSGFNFSTEPLSIFFGFLRGGCESVEFLETFVDIFGNIEFSDLYRYDRLPGYISRQHLVYGLEMAVLGKPEEFTNIVNYYVDRALVMKDARAALALYRLNDGEQDLDDFFDEFVAVKKDATEAGASPISLNWQRPSVQFADTIAMLDQRREEFLQIALDAGFGPAHIAALGHSPASFLDACSRTYTDEILAYPNLDEMIFDLYVWGKWELEKDLDNVNDGVRDAYGQHTFLWIANIQNDCVYSIDNGPGSPLNSDGYSAGDLVRSAMQYPFLKIDDDVLLAMALVLEQENNQDSINARARLALRGGVRLSDEENDRYFEWLNRNFSKPTLAEIQSILKDGGYYSGSIDGVMGRNMKDAVVAAQRDCDAMRPDPQVGAFCFTDLGIKLRAESWLEPHL
ncbi:MAG: peptidoglycan-binding domain-containing protein [Rhizobiaceae bacterium]